MDLQYQPFCVNKRKYVAVYWDLLSENATFVRSFDPTYYTYMADHHFEMLQREEQRRDLHATQLRILYSQALEALFAYIFGLLQAPFLSNGVDSTVQAQGFT